jgi:hypothetical protein
MLTGGCYCGAIRYEASGPTVHQTNCHCTMCRRTTGAPCVAWFTVASQGFKLLSGQPAQFRSSNHATRTFCSTCGTQLTFVDDAAPGHIDITTCSLDEPDQVPPHDHIFTRSRLAWLKLADGLPQHAGSRVQG